MIRLNFEPGSLPTTTQEYLLKLSADFGKVYDETTICNILS